MTAPDGFWTTWLGYLQIAEQQRSNGYEDLAEYFECRARAACVARFEAVCAERAAMVPVVVAAVERRAVIA